MSYIQTLIQAGFDESTHIPFTRTWRVHCSQCEALVINGVPCHEGGCPNKPRDAQGDDDGQ